MRVNEELTAHYTVAEKGRRKRTDAKGCMD